MYGTKKPYKFIGSMAQTHKPVIGIIPENLREYCTAYKPIGHKI